MSFLDDIFGDVSLGDVGSAGQSLGTALSAANNIFNPRTASENPALRAYNELISAAGDPKSSRFVNQAAIHEEMRRKDLLSAINAMMRANRRARARGAIGIGVNPERRDEAVASAILRGFDRAGDQSRLDAQNTLMRQAQQVGASIPAYKTYGDITARQRSGGYEAFFDMLGKMGGRSEPQQMTQDWQGAYNPNEEGYF